MSSCEHQQEVALALAHRAYLYSLMHVVFGGEPTPEGVVRVFSDQTSEVLDALERQIALPCFAEVAARELAQSGRSLQECVKEVRACVAKTRDRLCGDRAADAESLAEQLAAGMRSDFAKLFQVPGDAYVHPWESPYVGKESMLFQESTLDVRSFYHDAGLKLQAEKHFPDDHIAAMMDYLGRMSQRAYDAYADGLDAEAAQILETQRVFVEKHVLSWVDAFAGKVVENDAHAYYGALAGAMAAFARLDAAVAARIGAELEEALAGQLG